jgi:microcystin degradation protein MlrC
VARRPPRPARRRGRHLRRPPRRQPDHHLDDPEGALQALIRAELGELPFICSCDLHATSPTPTWRSSTPSSATAPTPTSTCASAARNARTLLRRLLAGERFSRAHRRLPIVAPTVSLLTAHGPYAEVIALGQQRQAADPRIVNVSVMAGFAYGDTPFNGLCAVVTATHQHAADTLADELAEAAWARRDRFVANLTPLAEATQRALATEVPLAFADVADNPGGGGRGNTTTLLQAFHAAGVEGAIFGVLHDPELAREAHALGLGARFEARFNRETGQDPFARPFAAEAEIRALSDGRVTGRRGIFAGTAMQLGRTAWLQLGGIAVVVIEGRTQCADPAFLEHLGLDVGQARILVVKSRGHFRGGFDEFFPHDRIVEVDAPGLTSPILSRFPWKKLPRPVLPLDAETTR